MGLRGQCGFGVMMVVLALAPNCMAAAKDNPFGLVYAGALVQNVPGKVQIRPVEYRLNGLRIAANLYVPAGYVEAGTFPAIVVAHPNATFRYTMSSLLDLIRFDASSQMDLIDQPLLMMAGEKADSKYMSDSAFAKATNARSKELFVIPGMTHIETYWKPQAVDLAMEKLTRFFRQNLNGKI